MSSAAQSQTGGEEGETERGTAIGNFFRKDVVGGLMLILAAALALVLANSPLSEAFTWLRELRIGPHALHLDLTLAEWAKDGLLAIFFFTVGLELKRELVTGELAHWKSATLPIIAALGGMVLPAVLAYGIGHTEPHAGSAWAIPMATDIAFAVGVLSLFGSWMPVAGRVFLLSLAVVDDLGAIAMIVVLFTDGLNLIALGAAVLLAVAYWYLQRKRVTTSWLYVPLGIALWVAVHTTGVHATIAGVVLGLLTRVKRYEHETSSPEERLEHRLSPWSAGLVVPIFAFFAAGVPVDGEALQAIAHDPVSIGVIVGLVVGKLVGVAGVSWLAIKVGLAHKPRGVGWPDMLGLAMLAGIGFTVSLLIAELSLTGGAAERAKAAVLIASALATVLAGVTLSLRGKLARGRHAEATADGGGGAD
ncbi:Na+/H+ antiporter NhaA [Bounagaea algeriensis]